MSTQEASSSSPTSSSASRWKFHVFLSFRGVDTRKGFTDHLYAALQQKGILTFRDDEKLEKGKSISPELLKAIEESRFAIIILSKNYASSTWCLDELAKIVRCMKDTGLTAFPVFYDVDPSNVRNQTRTFKKSFVKHENCFKDNIEKVETWRAALREVANLSGWHLKDRPESELVQQIVKEISNKLSSSFQSITDDLVGIDSSVEELITSYLGLGNNVGMIGICGMGGSGKTTLARVVYNKFSSQFEGSSFISNVREASKKYGLDGLQKQLLEEILKERIMDIRHIYDGVNMIKDRLCHKKVLLVLDDVNELDQLKNLAGKDGWFGLGSWIIITTRNEHLLRAHEVDKIYKRGALNGRDALKLFCLKAFKNEQPREGNYKQLSYNFVCYAKGLPLALETLGSFLVGKTMDEWQSALDSFKKIPKREIFDILKVSFDGLEEMCKEIFLDIACFFRGKRNDLVKEILNKCGFDATIGISVLIEKSLLTIEKENLQMHSLLQDMGREIVRQESPQDPGKRSRLWQHDDLCHVLAKKKAPEAIQAVLINISEGERAGVKFEAFAKAFSKMCNLRLLIIHYERIPNDHKDDSSKKNNHKDNLSFLELFGYSPNCLPSSFQPKELVELDSWSSKIKYIWEGVKYLYKLKCINLCLRESESYFPSRRDSHLPLVASLVVSNKDIQSSNLSSPNYPIIKRRKKGESGSPQRLEGQYGCIDLVEIHPYIGQLSRLFVLEREERRYHSLDRFSAYLQSIDSDGKVTICSFDGVKPIPCSLKLEGLELDDGVKPIPCSVELEDGELEDLEFKGHIKESQEMDAKGHTIGLIGRYKSADKSFTGVQGPLYQKTGEKCFTGRKEDGSRTALQIIIPGLEIPWWLTYQSLGNSVSIKLPPNWCSSKWTGLALCASFNAISSPSSADEFSNPVKTFGLRARVKIFRRFSKRGHLLENSFEIFFNVKVAPKHIWLLYLSRDDWFATVNKRCNQIEVVFETYSVNVRKCGAGLLYEQDMEEFHKTFAQCGGSNITTYEGWDGVHYEFENSLDPLL